MTDFFPTKPPLHKFARKQKELITLSRREIEESSRVDFKSFIAYMKKDYVFEWYHNLMIYHVQEFLTTDKYNKLIILLPPRSGKSEISSKLLPTFAQGVFSNRVIRGGDTPYEIIMASYDSNLVSEFVSQQITYIESESYKNIFPLIRICPRGYKYGSQFNRTNTSYDILTDNNSAYFRESGGDYKKTSSMRAIGLGGSITGKGADLIILDDVIKDIKHASSNRLMDEAWRWYRSVLSTRLENRYGKKGKILILNTRWIENDIAGKLLEEEGDEWKVIRLPAFGYAEDSAYKILLDERKEGEVLSKRMSLAYKEAKKTLSRNDWASLYQQTPVTEEGNIIKGSDIKFYTETPKIDLKIIVGDLAFAEGEDNDYTVYNLWGLNFKEQKYYLLDQVRGKYDYGVQRSSLIDFSIKYKDNYGTFIEKAANADAIYSDLHRSIHNFQLWIPRTDKIARVKSIQYLFEQHRVFYPDPILPQNAWVKDNIDELTKFPKTAHDDTVDAMSMALIELKKLVQDYSSAIVIASSPNAFTRRR